MPRHPLTSRASVRPLTLHGRRAALCPTSVSVAIFPQMAMAGSHDPQRGRGEPLPAGATPRRHGRSAAPAPPGNPPTRAFPKRISGPAVPPAVSEQRVGGKAERQSRRNRLQTPNGDHHVRLPCRRPRYPSQRITANSPSPSVGSLCNGRPQEQRPEASPPFRVNTPASWFVDRTGVLIL